MALNENIKVKMPEHCVKVPKNGTTYIQYTLRAYRNAKGKPTSDRIAIGKLDEATGMLIPNRNYYEIFEKKDPEFTPEFVRSNGVYALISEIAKRSGLKKALEQAFPENCNEILSVAQYMLTRGNVMYYYRDWLEETISLGIDVHTTASITKTKAKFNIIDVAKNAWSTVIGWFGGK